MANTFPGFLPNGKLPRAGEAHVKEIIQENPQLPKGGTPGSVLRATQSGSEWADVSLMRQWTAADQAASQGFWVVVSHTEPAERVYTLPGGRTVPIIWQKPVTTLVPVVPSEPIWDSFSGTVLVPDLVGVEYRTAAGVLITPAVQFKVATTVPLRVTVNALAKPGYRLPFTASWSHDFPDPAARTLAASSAFTTDQPNMPFPWDNSLGGTTPLSFTASSVDMPGYRAIGGVLTPNGVGADNVWIGSLFTYSNMALRFDVRDLGQSAATPVNAGVSGVAIRSGSRYNGGVSLSFSKNGAFTPAVEGASVQMPSLSPAQQLGTWELGVYGKTVSVTVPTGETYTGPLTIDLDTQANGSQTVTVRHRRDASGFKYDNFRLYRMGA